MYALDIGSRYNFTLRASSILGLSYTDAKVLGVMDYDSVKHVQDLTSLHIQAYPELPVGTERDASKLIWVKIQTSQGDIRAIAMDWIAVAPIKVTAQSLRVTISGITNDDVSIIRNLLVANGYQQIQIVTL